MGQQRVDRGRRTGGRPGSRFRVLVAVVALALLASACSRFGGGDEAEGGNGDAVEIRFSWWGSDQRAEMTREAIAAFEKEHPNIKVQGEYVEWSGYWDKLATSTAGSDAPDVAMTEERFLREYASRDALLNLDDYTEIIDLSNIDPLVLDSGRVNDGLYAIPTGVNAYAIVADPQAFADAGLEMPDDTTWTWEDYIRIATEISKASGGEVFGAQDYGGNEAGFKIFARQHGEGLYNQEGELAYSPETLAAWWQYSLDLRDSGGTPSASLSIEVQDAGSPEQTLVGTNRAAMMFDWTNSLGALTEAAGRELVLLRPPGETQFERSGMYLKPAMAYTISSQTEHPEEAAEFVNFMLNSEAAIDAIGTDRGLPANLEQRERITADLEADKAAEAEFIAEISQDVQDVAPTPPTGAGDTVDILKRINTDVLFDRLTPAQAAERFTSEVKAATGQS